MAEFLLTPQIKAMALRDLRELRGEEVFIVNKETSKPVRIAANGQVTANGGLGDNARFVVRRGHGPVVRFHNKATGKYLAIKNGHLTVGAGGEHCEFFVEQAQAAVFLKKKHNPNARIGFNSNGQPVPANQLGNGDRGRFFIFDTDHVAPQRSNHHPHPHHHHPHPHHHPQPNRQQIANAQNKAAANQAASLPQAEFLLTPQIKALALRSMNELKGETVFIVNAATSKPICILPNNGISANGNLGPLSQFRVHRAGHNQLNPVLKFQNVGTGKYLAIQGGNVRVGTGGEHCAMLVEMAQMAVFLRKHLNPNMRIGFNPDGSLVPCANIQDGTRGRFFIFDTNHVMPNRQPPIPRALALSPQAPYPGQRCILKAKNSDLCLHIEGGNRDRNQAIFHGGMDYALQHHNSQFVFRKTAFADTYIIQAFNSPLFLHALGGSKPNIPITLHGDEPYARNHPNSKFQVHMHNNFSFALKVHNAPLCLHASGHQREGARVQLHGHVQFAKNHPNQSLFQFIPI